MKQFNDGTVEIAGERYDNLKQFLEVNDSFNEEEVIEIISEVLFELHAQTEEEMRELRSDIKKELDSLKEAGLKREKLGMGNVNDLIMGYMQDTKDSFRSECCDAKTEVKTCWSKPECTDCGQENPDTYKIKPELKDIVGDYE